jgi:menaquinone-specific isochorismate synthase
MSLVSHRTAETPAEAAALLLEEVEALLEDTAALETATGLARVEVDAPGLDPLPWLRAQPNATVYWSDREQEFEAAGAGEAKIYKSDASVPASDLFKTIRADLKRAPASLRVFGGLRFDRSAPAPGPWQPFGAYRFAAPLFEAIKQNTRARLACNLNLEQLRRREERDRLRAAFAALKFDAPQPRAALPPLTSREDAPNREQWVAAVKDVLDAFASNRLRKVVLARESRFIFENDVDALALFDRLRQTTTFSFRYVFRMPGGAAFVGASPERLFKRAGTTLKSEALAGTRPRGATPEQDEMLGRELTSSAKEIREHMLVVDQIRGVFEKYCRAVRGGDRRERLTLRHCQHLLTRIEGMLREGTDDGAILDDLHPTPAMGGVPTAEALDAIARLEPFDRGWYTGPVGWVSRDAAEFAAAIRSGLVSGNEVRVYAGAGIVPGSDPAAEFGEIENKLTDFEHIFTRSGANGR